MRYHRWRESAGCYRPGAHWLTGAVRFTYAYSYINGNGDSNGYVYPDSKCHVYTDSHGNGDTHAHTYSNRNSDIHAFTDSDIHTYLYRYGDIHTDADSNADSHGDMQYLYHLDYRSLAYRW